MTTPTNRDKLRQFLADRMHVFALGRNMRSARTYLDMAENVLLSMEAAGVMCVPVEADRDMGRAARDCVIRASGNRDYPSTDSFLENWKTMLAASPFRKGEGE